MARNNLDPMAVVAARVVSNDPDIKSEMRGLILAMIKDAKLTMKRGSLSERQKLFGSVMPLLLRSMQSADANASEAAEQAAYARMMAMMRGEAVEGTNEQQG